MSQWRVVYLVQILSHWVRQILHDPSLYPNPHAFDPMRYLNSDGTLNPDVLDPTVTCFGFGRR